MPDFEVPSSEPPRGTVYEVFTTPRGRKTQFRMEHVTDNSNVRHESLWYMAGGSMSGFFTWESVSIQLNHVKNMGYDIRESHKPQQD